jgi:hypothetical protein
MKMKFLAVITALSFTCPVKCGHDGGAAVAGALGGLAIGTMIGHATAAPDKHSKADRLEEKLEQEQRARDQEKVRQLENKLEKEELKRKIQRQRIMAEQSEKEHKNMLTLIVLGIIAAILLALFGVGIAVLIHKRKGS